MIYKTVFENLPSILHCKYVYVVYLRLVPHPTVYETLMVLWYVCMYVCLYSMYVCYVNLPGL